MKLSVYSFKDNALGCFTSPFYDDRPLENVAIGVARSIASSEKKQNYKHKVLYKIADFDDATGTITPCDHVLVLDCDELLATIDPGKKDGEGSK